MGYQAVNSIVDTSCKLCESAGHFTVDNNTGILKEAVRSISFPQASGDLDCALLYFSQATEIGKRKCYEKADDEKQRFGIVHSGLQNV